MHPLFTDVYTTILRVLLPVRCVVCKQEAPTALCNECLNQLSPVPTQCCALCRKPSLAGFTHPACINESTLDQLLSRYNYTDPHVSELIIAGKYKFIPDAFHMAAPELGRLVKLYIELDTANTLVIPLPLHRYRQRWRGFNQAAILAQRMSLDLDIPYAEALRRHRRTQTQKDLKKVDRLVNIANCFSCIPQMSPQGKTILLVDDVITSGSTLQEAAKVLKQHGAARVVGVTLARD